VWSDDLGDAFLAILRETGNAEAAIRALGHGDMFYRRRREDPVFAARWLGAAEAADRELRARTEAARNPFPDRPNGPPPPVEPCAFPEAAATAKPALCEPVIRRNRAGRLQLALTREGDWNSDVESRFLAHLRRSGAFLAAARAVGFHFTSIYERLRRWPAFARDVEEALREADVKLEYALVGHAHALVRAPEEPPAEGEEDDPPFDPVMAMRILAFIDARRGGRVRGRGKGPPVRPFEEAVASILRKIEAIERHEKLLEERASSPPRAPVDPADHVPGDRSDPDRSAGGGCVSEESRPAEAAPPRAPRCKGGGQ
jgi:hypothetical protein